MRRQLIETNNYKQVHEQVVGWMEAVVAYLWQLLAGVNKPVNEVKSRARTATSIKCNGQAQHETRDSPWTMAVMTNPRARGPGGVENKQPKVTRKEDRKRYVCECTSCITITLHKLERREEREREECNAIQC